MARAKWEAYAKVTETNYVTYGDEWTYAPDAVMMCPLFNDGLRSRPGIMILQSRPGGTANAVCDLTPNRTMRQGIARNLGIVRVRVAVVGPGAIGSTIAACLLRAGHMLCGRTARDYLDVRPDPTVWSGERVLVPGPVLTDPDDVTTPVKLVLLAVKATQIKDASRWMIGLCDDGTTVCVLQNGVEHVDLVQPHCPASTVLPAIVRCPAETQADGWVRLRGRPALTLPADSGSLAATLGDGGCDVTVTDDFCTAAWHKRLANAVSGLMALTGRRAEMFRRDDVAALSRAYLNECLAVARAEGAQLGDEGHRSDPQQTPRGYDHLNAR